MRVRQDDLRTMMTLRQLSELLAHSTGPRASRFYRDFYGMRDGDPPRSAPTWDEWRALPVLTREAVQRVPLYERAFPPLKNMPTIVASSGTSGAAPLFSPFPLMDGYAFRTQYHTFSKATLVSLPTPHKKEWEIRLRGSGRVVALDPKRARASVLLAKAARVDSMFLFLYHVPLVAEAMSALGMASDIRYIEVSGEACSQAAYAYMRKMFPNAVIVSEYGSTDVEATPIGTPCRPMTGSAPLEVFHTSDRFYLEIRDPETSEILSPQEGAEGDLLITSRASDSAAFPLIRYAHGDVVRVVDTSCSEHAEWSFQVLGRRNAEFAKIPGGVLRTDETERVLRAIDDALVHDYVIRLTEVVWNGKPSIKITFALNNSHGDPAALSSDIAAGLRIGHTYTLADAVRDGLIPPVSCAVLTAQQKDTKRVKIVHEREKAV